MNQQRTPAKRMSYREWKIRKCLRLARNWVLFLAACGGAVALMATGILWLLPKAHALIAGPVPFAARAYSADGYVCDTDDARLVVVNANLPLESEPAPELAVADDATGEQLETEAAAAYRSMAEAAHCGAAAHGKHQRAGDRLLRRYPLAGLHGALGGFCRDPRLRVADRVCRGLWLHPPLAGGAPECHRHGLCTVALAVCGGRERPRHPRKRPFLGRIPRAGTRKTINLQKIEGETIETNRDRARRPSAVGPGA